MTVMKTWQRRVLGILALGGGFLGVVMILTQILAGALSVAQVVLAAPFVALYGWGTWCGLLLIEEAPGALRKNRWFWTIQVPYFVTPIVTYLFYAGATGILAYNLGQTRIKLTAFLGSQFQFHLNHGTTWELGINVFALGVAAWIWRLERRHFLPASDSVLEQHQAG